MFSEDLLLDVSVLKNRRLVSDLIQFCDARRPREQSLDMWTEQVDQRLDTRNVLSFGQFDVDGLDSSEREFLIRTQSRALGVLASITLIIGMGLSWVVLGRLDSASPPTSYQQKRRNFINRSRSSRTDPIQLELKDFE